MRGRPRASWARYGAVVALVVALTLAVSMTSGSWRSAARTWSTWAWEARYRLIAPEEQEELTALHADAGQASREQCVACHGDKDKSGLLVHRIHLQSELLQSLGCPECHQHVSLESRGSTTAATWVDVGICKQCHSAFPVRCDGAWTPDSDVDVDCLSCHTGALAAKHDRRYLPRDIAPAECVGCHGARVLPWTPSHEKASWLAVHGEEALDAGSETCFECHDFGLKFCDECHAEKPQSHSPAEQWRIRHPDEAQRDTRVCYTCHETGFCKGCHLNHEEGWMETHQDFVRDSGSTSCEECHSESSCSFCHMAALEGSAQPTVTP